MSIGGYPFKLETDAANLLQEYITSLEKHYMPLEGGAEIMEGIEERIAELLLDRHAQVITLADVQRVIDVIGRPEKIEADDPGSGEEPKAAPRRKLFRDMEDKRLGGVCSGLAAFLNMDVALMRLIWVLLTVFTFFGFITESAFSLTVPFIYCLLWIAMPAAKTAQDRWAMKGENVTLDEISRNVSNGIKEMGEAAKEVGKSDAVKGLGKVISMIMGFALLMIGVAGLASALFFGFKGDELLGMHIQRDWYDLQQSLPWLFNLCQETWFVLLMTAAVLIPFIGMLYGGCQLIFNFKEPSWKPGLWIFVIWLMILVALAAVIFITGLSAEGANFHELIDL